MKNDLLEKWTELLKPIFPVNSELNTNPQSKDYEIWIDWKLGDDFSRPNKRSREIQLKIEREAVEDYLANNSTRRLEADNRLRCFVEKNYENFNPDHDEPLGKTVSVEEWVVKTSLLNG